MKTPHALWRTKQKPRKQLVLAIPQETFWLLAKTVLSSQENKPTN